MLTNAQREELWRNPGTPVKEYVYTTSRGNKVRIQYYDAAYRGNTPEQNAKIWHDACRVACQIDINRQMAEKGLPPAYTFR